jgi:hypothetical protein
MDVVLSGCDEYESIVTFRKALASNILRMYFLNASYKSVFSLAKLPTPSADHWGRQLFSLWLIVSLGGLFFYLFFAAMSYRFMYDERLKAHPKVGLLF